MHDWQPSSVNKHLNFELLMGSQAAEERLRRVWCEPQTFLSFSEVGLRMVSSGRLGLGLGDSQELKKDWMKGSRCCPF